MRVQNEEFRIGCTSDIVLRKQLLLLFLLQLKRHRVVQQQLLRHMSQMWVACHLQLKRHRVVQHQLLQSVRLCVQRCRQQEGVAHGGQAARDGLHVGFVAVAVQEVLR